MTNHPAANQTPQPVAQAQYKHQLRLGQGIIGNPGVNITRADGPVPNTPDTGLSMSQPALPRTAYPLMPEGENGVKFSAVVAEMCGDPHFSGFNLLQESQGWAASVNVHTSPSPFHQSEQVYLRVNGFKTAQGAVEELQFLSGMFLARGGKG